MINSKQVGHCSYEIEWWIGNALRRYHEAHPGGLERFRRSKNWVKLLEWNKRHDEQIPEALSTGVTWFLETCHTPDNPWGIGFLKTSIRRGPTGRGGISLPVYQFSITKVVTAEEQERYMQNRVQVQRELQAPKRIEQEQRERERKRELDLIYEACFGGDLERCAAKQPTEAVTARALPVISFDFDEKEYGT